MRYQYTVSLIGPYSCNPQMIKTGLILSFLLLGRVSCYIDGRELRPQCRNMEIQHNFGSESGSRPFTIEVSPDPHNLSEGQVVDGKARIQTQH